MSSLKLWKVTSTGMSSLSASGVCGQPTILVIIRGPSSSCTTAIECGPTQIDVYAAFDFVVTAEHLPDWVGDKTIKQREPLLRIVSHLANGAKHFRATDPRHRSVRDVRVEPGVFDLDVFQHDAFDVGKLVVDLDGDEAAAFGPSLGIPELADQVLAFWRSRV